MRGRTEARQRQSRARALHVECSWTTASLLTPYGSCLFGQAPGRRNVRRVVAQPVGRRDCCAGFVGLCQTFDIRCHRGTQESRWRRFSGRRRKIAQAGSPRAGQAFQSQAKGLGSIRQNRGNRIDPPARGAMAPTSGNQALSYQKVSERRATGAEPKSPAGTGEPMPPSLPRYLRRRPSELVALSSLASASVLRMLRASRKISTQDNSST